ncbi:C-3',4' desaturase CrtD [Prochlorococcus marinus]|uniref:C-3',4' desaturase CrtD n=1 Tax=Prochlorococcus marinus TaxID=1219 RepID=UPI0022B375C3|nr:C-3',4' desaturase CrtD [Prochlorococcus marinus]
MSTQSVIVIGGGIAGLTAGALLAHEGQKVIILEAHLQPGGCAGTFRRGPYIFDVGATQVAGLEHGGIHDRIFRYLKSPAPVATILDPACVVNLGDDSESIVLWHSQKKWENEREKHFPDSQLFWSLCSALHKSNWSFAANDPVLPWQTFWDLKQFFKASRLMNFVSGIFSKSSMADLLWLCSCAHDQRLRKFLDLQLKLYSQQPADSTAALYGATVLQMAQAPLGLWHLKGSMQKLSDNLLTPFRRDGGSLLLGHKVVGLELNATSKLWQVDVRKHKGTTLRFQAEHLICTLPPQCLLNLMSRNSCLPKEYEQRIQELSQPSGAIVFYGALERRHLPLHHSSHLQLMLNNPGPLFISISQDGDGRAPLGQATVIASTFADSDFWTSCIDIDYQKHKEITLNNILQALHSTLNIDLRCWLHKELATPKSFARWTGRPKGIVGGLGQTPSNFGPFGLSSRTPMKNLWLCGDSIYPGEGTAGVSQSSLMVCRQLMAMKGRELHLPR